MNYWPILCLYIVTLDYMYLSCPWPVTFLYLTIISVHVAGVRMKTGMVLFIILVSITLLTWHFKMGIFTFLFALLETNKIPKAGVFNISWTQIYTHQVHKLTDKFLHIFPKQCWCKGKVTSCKFSQDSSAMEVSGIWCSCSVPAKTSSFSLTVLFLFDRTSVSSVLSTRRTLMYSRKYWNIIIIWLKVMHDEMWIFFSPQSQFNFH